MTSALKISEWTSSARASFLDASLAIWFARCVFVTESRCSIRSPSEYGSSLLRAGCSALSWKLWQTCPKRLPEAGRRPSPWEFVSAFFACFGDGVTHWRRTGGAEVFIGTAALEARAQLPNKDVLDKANESKADNPCPRSDRRRRRLQNTPIRRTICTSFGREHTLVPKH